MRTPRIYQPFANVHAGFEVELDDNAKHHLQNVMRVSVGQPIILFNGQGQSWEANITQLSKKNLCVKLESTIEEDKESPFHLCLAQGIAKGERMDLIMQKATELGVTHIMPIIMERTHLKLDEKRWEKKYAHWMSVVTSACEQSGRATLPKLDMPIKLQDWLQDKKSTSTVILDPYAQQSLESIKNLPSPTTLVIGPEGGLSPQEVTLIEKYTECHAVKLGPRILRTETAGLTAMSILQYRFGDLG